MGVCDVCVCVWVIVYVGCVLCLWVNVWMWVGEFEGVGGWLCCMCVGGCVWV